MNHKKCGAVVLAAGSGRRMGGGIKKQYMLLGDKPVVYYPLKVFQDSFIEEIVLVVSAGDVEYCRQEIVERYGFGKVRHIIEGGRERYDSVAAGLCAADCDFVFIHDGARPFPTQDMLERLRQCVEKEGACVAGMPVKDTVKISDADGCILSTPDRRCVWQIQTPQVFACELIRNAYARLMEKKDELAAQGIAVTDDAMVVERFAGHKVKLVEGSYENIKITTPEDIRIAEALLAGHSR